MLKFSIIIPAFNAEKTIENCIKSVQKQTYTGWEIIVINDGSTDKTAEIAKKMLPYSNVITTKNAGVSSARNIGISLSKGDYILFLDADDFLPPNSLELYERTIRTEKNADLIIGSFYKIYPQKQVLCNPVGNKKIYIYDSKKREFNPYISRLIGTVWGKCYKHSLIKDAKFDENLSICEDAEFNYRVITKAREIVYISQSIYNYVYSLNSTIRKYSDANLKKYVVAVNKIMEENQTSFFEQDVMEFICTVFNVVCFNLVLTSQNKEKYIKKRKTLRELRRNTSFGRAIENVDFKDLALKHRVTIFFAKYNMYFLLYLMSFANQTINKLIYKKYRNL